MPISVARIGSAKRCGACSQKAQCATERYKYLAIHINESARHRARELVNTPEFAKAQHQRTKVERCLRSSRIRSACAAYVPLGEKSVLERTVQSEQIEPFSGPRAFLICPQKLSLPLFIPPCLHESRPTAEAFCCRQIRRPVQRISRSQGSGPAVVRVLSSVLSIKHLDTSKVRVRSGNLQINTKSILLFCESIMLEMTVRSFDNGS
jgi:hypothetical protein